MPRFNHKLKPRDAFLSFLFSIPYKEVKVKPTTMKCTILASLIAGAAAFAPAQTGQASTTALSASFENEIGVQAPLGFFDPLGYLEDEDQERFEHLRWVELKVSPLLYSPFEYGLDERTDTRSTKTGLLYFRNKIYILQVPVPGGNIIELRFGHIRIYFLTLCSSLSQPSPFNSTAVLPCLVLLDT